MAGKINAEAVKITESMWLSKNADGSRLVVYYPVTDTIELLSTETGLTTSIESHNESDTSHADIRSLIGSTVGTHNSDDTAHTAIQDKIGTDIGTHNIAEDSHGDIRTALSTHTDDSTVHLGNADKIVVDADGNISAGYGGWAGLETDGATTFVRFGTATQSYKFTVTEEGGQIQRLIDGDYTPVNTIPTTSAVGTTVSGYISSHNGSGTAHSDIRTALNTHTGDTANPHDVTLAQLTGGLFSYADGNISDSGKGWWSGDSTAHFVILTANGLTTDNPIVNKTLTQKNATTPTTYFDQVCNAGGLPEIFRRSPTDSVPVNVGSPFMSGLHWGVCDNTPVSTVKYDGTNPCGGTFRKFTQVTSSELQFGANTNNRLYMPSSSSLSVGQRYIATCMFRAVAINGQTPPSCNYRLYLVIPTGGTLYVMTYSSVTPPSYNADGNSQVLSMEAVIDVLGVDASNVMFCMSSANGATLVQPTRYVSKTYTDANKPYFYLWASDTNLNTTWECYLADMSLYRIK